MSTPRTALILPHEVFFGGYLLITGLRLAATVGPLYPHTLVHVGLLLAGAAAVAGCTRSPDRFRWQLRLWFYFAAMNVVFFTMKEAIPRISPWRMDATLEGIDAILVGRSLSLRLEPWVHPAATEWFSFCYLLFFPYLLFSIVYYARRELPLFRSFMVGLFTIYGLGFLGYSLVPAAGPYLAMRDQFSVPLAGGFLTQLNARIVTAGSNGVDVFPSLHCAVSSYFLGFDRRHTPWRFRLYLVPCAGLWLSTLYLRYHYLVDLVVGFALSAFALWLARRQLQSPTLTPSRESL